MSKKNEDLGRSQHCSNTCSTLPKSEGRSSLVASMSVVAETKVIFNLLIRICMGPLIKNICCGHLVKYRFRTLLLCLPAGARVYYLFFFHGHVLVMGQDIAKKNKRNFVLGNPTQWLHLLDYTKRGGLEQTCLFTRDHKSLLVHTQDPFEPCKIYKSTFLCSVNLITRYLKKMWVNSFNNFNVKWTLNEGSWFFFFFFSKF